MVVFLRELMVKDAEGMLEWMHDEEIQQGFQKDMLHMTYQDARSFIDKSQLNQDIIDKSSIHYAIVDDKDDYLGTISLKNIDMVAKTAEYAVVVRRKFHRIGVASSATQQLFKLAFEKYNLESIYLYVIEDNTRAINCYVKNGFEFLCRKPQSIYKNGRWINQSKYMIDRASYEKHINNKLKVMHLIWSMGDGGAQRVIINYLRDFVNDPEIDLRVCVYTKPTDSKYDREIADNEYPVVYLNNPQSIIKIPIIRYPFNRIIARKEWYKVIKDYSPDIVHVHISGLLLVTMVPIIRANIPVRFDTLHSNPLRYKGYELRVIKKAFNKYNFVPICVTDEQGEIAKKQYGFHNYELVRNGIDTEVMEALRVNKFEARSILDLPKDAFVVLGVGRLNPIKNFTLLVRTFKCVYDKNDKAFLIIAGAGEELQRLEKLAIDLKVDERVKFLGNRDDMNIVYSSADVLAMTSISEAAPLTLIEAQVIGIRCVVSSGVSSENFIMPNVRRMSENASELEWADALMDEDYYNNSLRSKCEYDVHRINHHLRNIYLKHWNCYLMNSGKLDN